MSILNIIFQPIITFALVASFSLFFMEMFLIAGILSTEIQRNVEDESDEMKNLNGYTLAAMGGLISGGISLAAMTFM